MMDVDAEVHGGSRMTPASIQFAAAHLRQRLRTDLPLSRIACALAAACRRIASVQDQRAYAMVEQIARRRGWARASLRASLAALCCPFLDASRLIQFAKKISTARRLIGFVMAGNIPGAGLHEVIAALLAGCAVILKPASAEPEFFTAFAQILQCIDPEVGARLVVLNWPRERSELTAALGANCDALAVYGGDPVTIESSALPSATNAAVAGFGERFSIAVVAVSSEGLKSRLARALARDVSLFEQCGCLSPHHLFVLDRSGDNARNFAALISEQMQALARGPLPPPRLTDEQAAAIRHAREEARWKALEGATMTLWDPQLPGPTIIFDRDASFTPSPGYRTLRVSPFADADELARRLAPLQSRLEACALEADPRCGESTKRQVRQVIEDAGATYVCAPGAMQSPPLEWNHGAGVFHRLLGNAG